MRSFYKSLAVGLSLFLAQTMMAQDFAIAVAKLESDYKMPEKVSTQVKNRIMRLLSHEGLGSTALFTRFAIAPKISILSESTSSGIPPVCDVEFALNLDLVDYRTGKLFASYEVDLNGKGSNKVNAISTAIRKADLNGPEAISFLGQAKGKVKKYYEEQAPIIIRNAKQAIAQEQYSEAIEMLMELPEGISNYSNVSQLLNKAYLMYLDQESKALIQKATAVWMASQDKEGAQEAVKILSKVTPSSKNSKQMNDLLKRIGSSIKNDNDREWKFMMKELDASIELNKAKMQYSRDIAVAIIKSQPRTIINNNRYVVY